MEVVTENSNAAVADTGLHADSVPSGASTLGAVEGSVLGAQPRSPSLEPRVITLASSSQFYPSVSSYTIRNMSVAVAESSPRTFFSSSPVTSVLSCASSAMEAQVPTIYSDSTCFSYENQELYTSTTVTLPATNARMFGFSGPSPDTSTEFERRTQYAQQDIHPMYANSAYASSETAPAMSAAESHPQFVVQPSGTTSEVSPSLHAIEGYYGGETSASQCISLDSENPSLSVVADGNDDPTSLRVIDDSDDPTLLRSTDALEDLSLSHTSVPPHSAEHSSIAVELPPQSCITAEELPPPQVPAETTAEVLHPLRNVNVAHSSAHSERPVAASSDLSSERSSWPSTNPTSASTIRGEKRQREAEVNEHTENPAKRSRKQCGAGNLKCGMETGRSVPLGTVPGSDCDICCIEPGFCRECTCILCCQIIVPDAGDCNLVRCMHRSPAGGICGHGAHLECALKSQMAGVVKERDLDMEYLCRRCDSKTDLRELVTRLLEAVGNTLKRSVAEKCLQLALQIMKGTEHGGSGARVLESLVQTALEKVQRGVDIQEVFSDLKDQGMAAEAAKQQCLSRATSHGEDVSQQPEASLDQWLPSHNSPSSHPSPGTPSSFSSPIIRRNASVNSRADGTEVAEACNHAGVEGHTDESEEAIRSPERKLPGPRSNPSGIKSSQVRVSSRRARAGSSTSDFKHEATFQSQPAARNGKHQAHESGSRSPNLRTKSDQKGVSFGAGMQRDEPCKSCGATRPASQGLEVTSGLPSVKAEVEVRKSNHLPPTRKEVDLTTQDIVQDAYDVERHTEHSGIATQGTSTALVSSEESRKALGVSLVLLDDTCQQQVQSVLQKLRQAQQAEFLRAQERLIAQKDRVLKRYELLETARCEFDRAEISSSHHLIDFDRLMLKLSAQLAKASEERQTFDKMLKVAGGFGRLSRDDLNKYYDWPPEREVDSRD